MSNPNQFAVIVHLLRGKARTADWTFYKASALTKVYQFEEASQAYLVKSVRVSNVEKEGLWLKGNQVAVALQCVCPSYTAARELVEEIRELAKGLHMPPPVYFSVPTYGAIK